MRRVLVSCAALLAACQLEPPPTSGAEQGARSVPGTSAAASRALEPASFPDAAPDAAAWPLHATTRSVVTWNLQWFLDPTRGPSDEPRQLAGARTALLALAPDLLALQELSSEAALSRLLDGTGLRAGAITSFDWPQQLAIACSERLRPIESRVLDELSSAGRAPLEVELEDRVTGARVVAIALHAKAYADADSWRERRELAEGLHAYVQARWPDAAVILLGDFNDGLTRSIVRAEVSPYVSLVEDPRWAAPTAELERADAARALLDHVLVSDELAAHVVAEATERVVLSALGVESSVASVSDHAPIQVRLTTLFP